MKKILSMVLALCLIVALLPAMAAPARAASVPVESCLQWVCNFDVNKEKFLDDDTPCMLVKSGEKSMVITSLGPRDGCVMTFYNMATDTWFGMDYAGDLYGVLHVYEADSAFGEKEGFLPMGAVTQNEAMRYVVLDCNYNAVISHTVAVDFDEGEIIPRDRIETDYIVPLVTSNDELCGFEYQGTCIAFAPTTEEVFYGRQSSDEPEPAPTEPAPTEPAPTEPAPTEADVILKMEEAVGLKDLDKLYADAVVQKKSSAIGAVVIALIAVVIVALVGAMIVVKRKNKANAAEINEAEEGTVLADAPVGTGVKLRFRNGGNMEVKYSFTIGRAPSNDVVVSNTTVSGRHCEIVVQNGAVYLRDLGSTNGTFINGRKLAPGQLVQLFRGMTVGLGSPNGPEGFEVV